MSTPTIRLVLCCTVMGPSVGRCSVIVPSKGHLKIVSDIIGITLILDLSTLLGCKKFLTFTGAQCALNLQNSVQYFLFLFKFAEV